jgi:hypothetical protein
MLFVSILSSDRVIGIWLTEVVTLVDFGDATPAEARIESS